MAFWKCSKNGYFFLENLSLFNRNNNFIHHSLFQAEQVARDWGAKDYIECCAKTGYNIPEVFKSAAQVFLASNDEKSNAYGFKGLSMFRRRKSTDTSEIFYSSYESSTPSRFYPSYATRSYLRRASDAST